MSAAQMTRAGIHEVLAASFDLPPGHMSERTRLEFLQLVFDAYAWCIREELATTISNEGKGVTLTPAQLKDMRETFAVERSTAADNLADFSKALAIQDYPERNVTH